MYYLQSRYYNPEIGRFINADGTYNTKQGLLGHNLYTYCLDNPINLYDPDGRCSRFLGFLWKMDCGKVTCSESKNYDPSAARVAVLYDARTSGFWGLWGEGFRWQGKNLTLSLKMQYNVEEHPFSTLDEFVDGWNSLEGEYEQIYILSHGYPGGLSCAGKSISNTHSTEYNLWDLNPVSAQTVYLYSCNGATLSGNSSVADCFTQLTNGSVWAVANGSLKYIYGTYTPIPTDGGVWSVTRGRVTTYMDW